MKGGSLRLRLLLASAISIVLVLSVAGFGLAYLFEQHVERRFFAELDNTTKQLIRFFDTNKSGKAFLRGTISDQRFTLPYSGFYWQIDNIDGPALRSRSLWDFALNLPAGDPSGSIYEYSVKGPGGSSLLAVVRTITRTVNGHDRSFRFAAALNHDEVSVAVSNFATELGISLAFLGVLLLATGWAQVTVGLRPLVHLRHQIAAIRMGRSPDIEFSHPNEIKPLVDEIGALLGQQETAMEQARTRAGSLAHGLKTPLAVLTATSRRLRESGDGRTAAEIDEEIDNMRRHVERELARARIRGSMLGVQRNTLIASLAERIVATLKRLPKGDAIDWQVNIPPSLTADVDTDDLAEIFGNLLDNARKWASAAVTISAQETVYGIGVTIEDDGPGVDEVHFDDILKRGDRRDETVQGTGLGLAIAHDVLAAYGVELLFFRSSLGGFGVSFSLPATT